MTPELWERVCAALDALVPLATGQREAELQRLRQADPEAAAEVESLLRHQDAPRSFDLESVVASVWARVGDVGQPRGKETTPTDELPTAIGPYRVQEQVGKGGMGVVFRARDRLFRRSLAVKLLAKQHTADPDLKRRFLEEAQLMGQLQHPGIPPVHDLGELPDGRPYFAMKLIRGRTLAALLKERSSPDQDLPRFLSIFEQMCQTLAYVHKQGVIHRDLKPANIMVGAFGEVQVMDWGLAKVLAAPGHKPAAEEGAGQSSTICTARTDAPDAATQAGLALGTPAYMAPEQARGERDNLDERCDVFGLAAILCEILTGQPPFTGRNTREILVLAQQGKTEPALARLDQCSADHDLVQLARDCLSCEKEKRPANAGMVLKALRAYLDVVKERLRQAELEEARKQARLEEQRKRQHPGRQKQRILLILGGIVFVVLVAGVLATTLALTESWKRPGHTQEADAKNEIEVAEGQRQEAETQKKLGVLLVAQGRAGHYHSITAALAEAKPGSTIRVIDSEEYTEPLILDPERHENLKIEATNKATVVGPKDKWALTIGGVPGVCIRGLKFRASASAGLIWVGGRAPGVRLEELELELAAHSTGILFDNQVLVDGDQCSVVRRCKFVGYGRAIDVSGTDSTHQWLKPAGNVSVQENIFSHVQLGVICSRAARRVHIVGNRFLKGEFGIRVYDPRAGMGEILIANNTFCRVNLAFSQAWPNYCRVAVAGLEFSGNLCLGCDKDVMAIDYEPSTDLAIAFGDGPTFRSQWKMIRNWREGKAPGKKDDWARGWAAPKPTDVLRESQSGIPRDETRSDFLVPDSRSELATGGANEIDPCLPPYAGAKPPSGGAAWDWGRTWDARAAKWPPIPPPNPALRVYDPNVLIVSKEGKTEYRTIGAALAAVRPGQTIRVVDKGEYNESLLLEPADHKDLTLEAPRGATIQPLPGKHGIFVKGVSGVTVRGFQFRGPVSEKRTFLFAKGAIPGLRLEGLKLRGTSQEGGVYLSGVDNPGKAPAVIRDCEFRGLGQGIGLDGVDVLVRSVRIESNSFQSSSVQVMGINQRLHIVGNRFWAGRRNTALTVQLYRNTRDVLIANNTFYDNWQNTSFYAPDDAIPLNRVRICGNLMAHATIGDLMAYRWMGDGKPSAKADGTKLRTLMRFDHNWREGEPSSEKACLPDGPDDCRLPKLPLLSLDPNHPDFLRPGRNTVIAKGGVGGTDPPLPAYAGALPPFDAALWDWNRTWSIPRQTP